MTNTTIYLNATVPFDFNNFENHDFNLNEIVNSLSKQCRFNGHINKFYSVLQHCMFTYEIACILYPDDKLVQQHALVHDFHEAYVSDIVTPLANYLCTDKIEKLKNDIDTKIFKSLNINEINDHDKVMIKTCDKIAYELESTFLGNLASVKTDLKGKDHEIVQAFNKVECLNEHSSVFKFWWEYEMRLR